MAEAKWERPGRLQAIEVACALGLVRDAANGGKELGARHERANEIHFGDAAFARDLRPGRDAGRQRGRIVRTLTETHRVLRSFAVREDAIATRLDVHRLCHTRAAGRGGRGAHGVGELDARRGRGRRRRSRRRGGRRGVHRRPRIGVRCVSRICRLRRCVRRVCLLGRGVGRIDGGSVRVRVVDARTTTDRNCHRDRERDKTHCAPMTDASVDCFPEAVRSSGRDVLDESERAVYG